MKNEIIGGNLRNLRIKKTPSRATPNNAEQHRDRARTHQQPAQYTPGEKVQIAHQEPRKIRTNLHLSAFICGKKYFPLGETNGW
ncbi:hypothetical protein [Candidatus Thiosymbion oneisti]|uniref:hypothetical protein n=1 Tax=Candidatus Thiosymbion oneisti TaxID=589554 RepID=UPI00114CC458|nr:hypothetical protein [Candidatus Thiosymbion oneisti]